MNQVIFFSDISFLLNWNIRGIGSKGDLHPMGHEAVCYARSVRPSLALLTHTHTHVHAYTRSLCLSFSHLAFEGLFCGMLLVMKLVKNRY